MFTIIITTRDGTSYTEDRETEQEARALCIEELKWEGTARVQCEALGIDEEGDFVGLA